MMRLYFFTFSSSIMYILFGETNVNSRSLVFTVLLGCGFSIRYIIFSLDGCLLCSFFSFKCSMSFSLACGLLFFAALKSKESFNMKTRQLINKSKINSDMAPKTPFCNYITCLKVYKFIIRYLILKKIKKFILFMI